MSKSKKYRNEKRKNTNVVYKTDEHFVVRLQQRFVETTLVDVMDSIKFCKKYSVKNIGNCPFKVVSSKLRNSQYSDSVYIVNTKLNMIIVSVNNTLKNVLYLDGRDGYNFSN